MNLCSRQLFTMIKINLQIDSVSLEYHFFDRDDKEDYFNGKFDGELKDHVSYVPSTQEMPKTWDDNSDEEAKTESTALEDNILNSTIDDEETGMSESMSVTDFLNLDIDEIL